MKKLLIFFLLFPSNIFGDYIIHDRIHESNNNLPCIIEAFLNKSIEDIHTFSLLYRPKGNLEYLETPMISMGQLKYMALIPGNFMISDAVEYYLRLELSYGENITFPVYDAMRNPIIIQIDFPTENIIPTASSKINNFDIIGLSPEIIIISPQPGERVKNKDLFIALSYFGEKNIDPTKVRVYLDGLDMSKWADIDTTYLSLTSESITPGTHTVTVNISNTIGQKFEDISWSFTVLSENTSEGIGLIPKQSGSMWANYTGARVDNSVVNIGELNIQYKFDMDLFKGTAQYTKSSLENKYDQPHDRYNLNLKNNLMSIKLGDSYPSIDPYALNGHHVRGINFNFNQNLFSVDFIKGNTARAIQGDPLNGAIVAEIDSTTDPANWIILLSRDNYSFQQELFAANMRFQLDNKFLWNANIIKVDDNISTVGREINNAEIIISTSDNLYSISYDSLLKNHTDIFGTNTTIKFPSSNWKGNDPLGNLIFGSNMQFGFDDSRIKVSSGFSLSFLNRNKWNNLNNITELDTFSVDTTLDGLFMNSLQLDTTIDFSQYEYYNIYFGTNELPFVPSVFQQNRFGLINILNMSNLNRYSKLQLRYLGHRVELGMRRNGPDYYSILNPYLKTNFTEEYFSDRLNLFHNKLLLYYQWSKIIEGLYYEQIAPTEIRKSLFNISLFPGTGLPTFNLGFLSTHRNNGLQNVHIIDTDTLDFRVDQFMKQFNISMTNQFKLWVDQVLSVNILLFSLIDQLAENVSNDSLNSIGYLPKDATSESYGISLKSIYNNYWESTVYYNASNYDYGRKGFDYNNDGIDDFQVQTFHNMQLNILYRPNKYVSKLHIGLSHSSTWVRNSLSKSNIKFGAVSDLIRNLQLSLYFDYRIRKFPIPLWTTPSQNPNNNIFITAQLQYKIL